jgi:hypothetical protein
MNSKWTVIFDDKQIINQSVKNEDGWPQRYIIDNDAFWNDAKWNNIHAIQFVDDDNDHNDCVEYVPGTLGRNTTWAEANLGSFRDQFIVKWDAAHLARLQKDWDDDNGEGETPEQKINRLGNRPTSFTSP